MEVFVSILFASALAYISDSQRKINEKIEEISERLLILEIRSRIRDDGRNDGSD